MNAPLPPSTDAPVYDVDLYADDVVRDPYPHYRRIRELGSAVWLPRNGLWAIGRFADVQAGLAAHDVLVSSRGVAANDIANAMANANLLATDPPLHDHLRRIIAAPLMPRALDAVAGRIAAAADALIERLVQRERFDGMTELAHFLPVSIVSELVGLPEAGRENMLRWAAATFDMLGGANARLEAALPVIREMRAYCDTEATPDKVRPGGWVALLYDAAREGLIETAKVPVLMRDYLGPSLDTTIFATGHLLHQLARHPRQWQRLREDPRLIPNAINEAVRYESPIRGFTRFAAGEYAAGDVTIPAGARVLLLYASANRDERQWDAPDTFDIGRKAMGHLGFGHGVHACAGMQLARLEMRCLLAAMVARVRHLEAGEPELAMNNVLRGFSALPMRFEAG